MTSSTNINQAIDYQKGSVVSKEIFNKSSSTVTLFAFDKGQGLSEHTASADAVIVLTDGVAEIIISDEKYRVKAGEVFFIPANTPHSLKAVQSFKMILTMIG